MLYFNLFLFIMDYVKSIWHIGNWKKIYHWIWNWLLLVCFWISLFSFSTLFLWFLLSSIEHMYTKGGKTFLLGFILVHMLQIKFFHKVGSMNASVTDSEKLIWSVLEAERPTIRFLIQLFLFLFSPFVLLETGIYNSFIHFMIIILF